jgi:thioredoxin-like negative regulator of GroEL
VAAAAQQHRQRRARAHVLCSSTVCGSRSRSRDCRHRYALERQFHAAGHGEYREITEEEFLKEVCGSQWVVVHFHHREFFRCKIVDKHLKILAQKHLSCKWLTLDAEKAPFFIAKLAVRMLPTVIVFKDGVVCEQFEGFDEMGGKDDFRTEVMELWFSKVGCVKIKAKDAKKALEGSESEKDSDEDD